MKNQFTCIALHCIFIGSVLFLLGCTKEKDDFRVDSPSPESGLKPSDPGYVLTKSDSLLASYIYLENGRYGIALSLDEALSMGIREVSYQSATEDIEKLNQSLSDYEKKGIPVHCSGISRDSVGIIPASFQTRSIDADMERPWYGSVSLDNNSGSVRSAYFKGYYKVRVVASGGPWAFSVEVSTSTSTSGSSREVLTGSFLSTKEHTFVAGLSDQQGFVNWWFDLHLVLGASAYVSFNGVF